MDPCKKRTVVVNFLGSPCVGKSLLSALTFAELKLRGKVCEYVQEFAKTLVWLKDFTTLNDQYHVSSRQNGIIRSIVDTGQIDYIITDGPLLNGLYYNRYNPDNVSSVERLAWKASGLGPDVSEPACNIWASAQILQKTEKFILDRYAEYDNFNVYLRRGNFAYETAGRIQTLEEAKEVDVILYQLLKEKLCPISPELCSGEMGQSLR